MTDKVRVAYILSLISLPLVICGVVWNPQGAGIAAVAGVAIMLWATLGDTFAPTANNTAYYHRATGRRVHPDGTPYYSWVEDVQRYGKVKGTCWFLRQFVAATVGACLIGGWVTMSVYGVYAAFRLVVS